MTQGRFVAIPFSLVPLDRLLDCGMAYGEWNMTVTAELSDFGMTEVATRRFRRMRFLMPKAGSAAFETRLADDSEWLLCGSRDETALADSRRHGSVSSFLLKDGVLSISASYCAVDGRELVSHSQAREAIRTAMETAVSALVRSQQLLEVAPMAVSTAAQLIAAATPTEKVAGDDTPK